MLTIVIPTRDNERALVATLAALVSGVTAGLVRDVVVADAGSHDGTAQVADAAGCEVVVSERPLGDRLSAAARLGRGDWLLFLRPGIALDPAWTDEATRFLAGSDDDNPGAATFRSVSNGHTTLSGALMRLASAGRWHPDRGLLVRRAVYESLGGHRADDADPERALLRRLGRRRMRVLRCDVIKTTV